MDWKESEPMDGDKVLAALAVAMNAESGVDELFKRVVALELASKSKASKATVADTSAKGTE
jgi:hypothetical protein